MTKQGKVILIIVIVGACCAAGLMVILLLAAVSIPAMQATIRHGNETSAAASLRLINIQEQSYSATYPDHGFTCSLTALGGSPQSGPASPEAAQLIPSDLASGHKAGYTFAISNCVKATIKGQDMVTSYKLTAVPDVVGKTGQRGFCTDESSVMKSDPAGGTNCTQKLE